MKLNFLKKAAVVGITFLLVSQISLPSANASWGLQKLLNNNTSTQETSQVQSLPTNYADSNQTNSNTNNSNSAYLSSRELAYQRLLQSRQGTTNTNTTLEAKTTDDSSKTTNTPVSVPQVPDGQSSEMSKDVKIMFDLVNGERVKNGLKPLAWQSKLGELAFMKSEDIVKNNYFSHTSPTYGSFYSMVYNAGVSFRQVGENLAMARDVNRAFMLLMASEGHRNNILSSNFTHIGIGVVPNQYGVVVTQLFIAQ